MLFVLSSLFRRGANYVFILFLSISLTASQFGEFSALLNRFSYFLIIANLGYNDYALVKAKNETDFNQMLTNGLFLSLISFLLVLGGGIVSTYELWITTSLIVVKVFFENTFYTIILARFQYKNKLKRISWINVVYGSAIIAISLVAYSFSFNVDEYLIPISIVAILVIGLGLTSRTKLKLNIRRAKIDYTSREFVFYAFSFICVPIYMQMPSFFASYFLENEQMAIFQIAFTISNVVLLVSLSYMQFKFGEFLSNKNELKSLIRSTILILVLINGLFIILFYLIGGILIEFVYSDTFYKDAIQYVCLLGIINLLIVIASSFATALVVNEKQQVKLNIQLKTIATGILTIPISIYFFALDGLIIATLLTFTVSLILYFKSVRGYRII